MIVKVPATWEGLQACRSLQALGIKTLATTIFTLEQAVLAAEVGCVYVSPFANALQATMDARYHIFFSLSLSASLPPQPSLHLPSFLSYPTPCHSRANIPSTNPHACSRDRKAESNAVNSYADPSPIFDVIVAIQHYYEEHGVETRVKACATVNVQQTLSLAGVHAFTATADQLQELANMDDDAVKVMSRSFFLGDRGRKQANTGTDGSASEQTNGQAGRSVGGQRVKRYEEKMKRKSFIDDEPGFRLAFAKADSGRGQLKTTQVSCPPPLGL